MTKCVRHLTLSALLLAISLLLFVQSRMILTISRKKIIAVPIKGCQASGDQNPLDSFLGFYVLNERMVVGTRQLAEEPPAHNETHISSRILN